MTFRHALALAAAFGLGYYVSRHGIKAGSTGATAHNDVNDVQDWWTYAGSWS